MNHEGASAVFKGSDPGLAMAREGRRRVRKAPGTGHLPAPRAAAPGVQDLLARGPRAMARAPRRPPGPRSPLEQGWSAGPAGVRLGPCPPSPAPAPPATRPRSGLPTRVAAVLR